MSFKDYNLLLEGKNTPPSQEFTTQYVKSILFCRSLGIKDPIDECIILSRTQLYLVLIDVQLEREVLIDRIEDLKVGRNENLVQGFIKKHRYQLLTVLRGWSATSRGSGNRVEKNIGVLTQFIKEC